MTDEGQRQALAREAVRKKLPEWSSAAELRFPQHISLEQCSSQQTAEYKARLINPSETASFVDLTGGFGVDCYYIGRHFSKATYIEQNPDLCETARHNYAVLQYSCGVFCMNSEEYLKEMSPVSLIFIDPARRDNNGRRTYAIEDCTPDVGRLNALLLEKASKTIIKLSPMFDWHKAVSDLKGVTEVHIVSVGNECKELLLVLEREVKPLKLFCANDDDRIEICPISSADFAPTCADINDYKYMYEPNASIMKAGCFNEVARMYALEAVSCNSHLFLSNRKTNDFPGRKFEILAVSSLNKKEVKAKLSGIEKANITTRNFPMKAEELRRRLKLGDGGDIYIFATTTKENKHIMLVCKKIFTNFAK